MTIFSGFGDADQPWLPELIDIEAMKTGPEAGYYKKFGWEQLVVPTECPLVGARMAELKVRFDERYANRMLNSETLERWQVRLQNRFDEKVHIYERAYRLYQQYEQDMLDDVVQGEKVTVTGTTQQGGSDSSTVEARNIDTPDEVINANDDYASSLSKNQGTTQYGRTDTVDSTTTRTVTGQALVEGINNAIYSWRDLDTEFVKEFENNFLNVYWY